VEVESKKKFPENGSSEATGNHPNIYRNVMISLMESENAPKNLLEMTDLSICRAMEKGRWWRPSFLRNCLSSTRRGPPIMRSSESPRSSFSSPFLCSFSYHCVLN